MTTLSTFSKQQLNGWSLLAVKSSFDAMTEGLRRLGGVIDIEHSSVEVISWTDGVGPRDLGGNPLGVVVHHDHRDIVLASLRDSLWCIALRSIDFVYSEDIDWVRNAGQQLSANLESTTVACYGEEVCDCFVFEKGQLVNAFSGRDVDEASTLFDEFGVSVPACLPVGNPVRIAATEETRAKLQDVALLQIAMDRPPVVEASKVEWRKNYFKNRMIASTCLDIVKLKHFVPCEIRDNGGEFRATMIDVVFDPLRIDSVNHAFRDAGYKFDETTTMVIAVNDDESILLWTGNSGVLQLWKGGSDESPNERRAFNDILGLTFPFMIKNKKSEVDAMLAQLRSKYGE